MMHSAEYGFALLALAVLHVFAHGLRWPGLIDRFPPVAVGTMLGWAASTAIMVLCALRLMGIYAI